MKERILETRERYCWENEIFEKTKKQVLGCLLNDTTLLDRYGFCDDDFKGDAEKVIFGTIKHMHDLGYKSITIDDINDLSVAPYQEQKLDDMIIRGIERFKEYHTDDFVAKYETVKKFALLRALSEQGIDVGHFYQDFSYNTTRTDESIDRYNNFCNASYRDIQNYYTDKIHKTVADSSYHTALDIQSYKQDEIPFDRDSDPVIIDDIIRNHSVNAIVGESKAGKSFLATQMAYCVANGFDFLGHPTHKRDVLIVDYEMPADQLDERGKNVIKYLGDGDNRYNVLPLATYDFIDLDTVINAVKKEKLRYPNLGLVIFDDYYLAQEGEENKAEDVKATLQKLKKLTQSDVAVVYVHHTTKAGVTGRALNAGSGSGVHGRFIDQQLTLRNKKDGLVDIDINGRVYDGEIINTIRSKDTYGFFELHNPRETIAGSPYEHKITKDDLREKYPDICNVIDKQLCKNTTLKHLKKMGYDYTINDLKAIGFIYNRDKQHFSYPN